MRKKEFITDSYNTIQQKLAKKSNHNFFVGLIVLVVLFIGVLSTGILLNSQQEFRQYAAGTATDTSLPVPSSINIIPEDTSVLMNWNNQNVNSFWFNPKSHIDQKTDGYVIYWGECSDQTSPSTTSTCPALINPLRKISEAPNIQLQPLQPGKFYGAYVQSVGWTGLISDATPIMRFQTDDTRVKDMRTRLTGFFDDFNKPAGFFDELKWNSAFSGCVGINAGGQFINAQFHAHNQASTGFCDRGQAVSRPRAIFDFTGRTGSIEFDMDGAEGRDTWYLDLFPESQGFIDVPGHAHLDVAGMQSPPIQTLRIKQGNGGVTNVSYFDTTGAQIFPPIVGEGCSGGDTRWCNPPAPVVKNYRRHWKISINHDSTTTVHVKITVDGALVAESNNVPFPSNRASMDWVLFPYNSAKENFPTSLLHWDNFGFDGPAQTIETHNYTNGIIGTSIPDATGCSGGLPMATTANPVTQNIKIPDSIAGATAARFMFTVTTSGCSGYGTSTSDNITINGKSYKFNDPQQLPINANIQPGTIIPEQETINIPLADLGNIKQGDNTIVYNLTSVGILNAHMEFDFPKGQAPSYTPPSVVYPNLNPVATNPPGDIGPGASIQDIGGYYANDTWNQGPLGDLGYCGFPSHTTDPQSTCSGTISHPFDAQLSGIQNIWFGIHGENALNGTGTNPGITEYDIIVDRQRIFAKQTNLTVPAPSVFDVYSWDTAQTCNGVHEVFLLAFNPNGTESLPDYFQSEMLDMGEYNPFYIITNNPGKPACPTLSTAPHIFTIAPAFPVGGGAPTPTSAPTAIPTTTATGTPIPTSIATPTTTAIPTATKTPTPTSTPSPTPTPTPISPLPTSVVNGSTFGFTGNGTAIDPGDAQNMNGSRFVMGSTAGKTTSMTVLVGNVDSSPNNSYQMAIYSDVNGAPGNLVAQTGTGTLKANSWNTLPITATLNANTAYWLMYNTNGTSFELNNMYVTNVTSSQGAWAGQSFGAWPSSFPQANIWAGEFSIFASYSNIVVNTPTPPPPTATPTPVPADTTAPSVPQNLAAQAVSTSQINLVWGLSTDNIGVTGYDVFRNGAQIATVGGTTFGDNTLNPSTTYSYTVRARDAAGNVSGNSTTATAITQAVVTIGNIAGVVKSTTGIALCNVKVSTLLPNNSRLTTYTNCQGQYTLSNLTPGFYSVTYSKSRYVSQTIKISVTSGLTSTSNIVLRKK